MAYSDFRTLRQLEERFVIHHQFGNFLTEITPVAPTIYFENDLHEALLYPTYPSEKAKSELLIMPILKEIRRHSNTFQVFSGFAFDVDVSRGLNGFCDYLLSRDPNSVEIADPVFCVVEAKDRTVEEGFAQAGAEMLAAQLYNQQRTHTEPVIYGCVTNADVWMFLRLIDTTLTIDRTRFYISERDVPVLIGAFLQLILLP